MPSNTRTDLRPIAQQIRAIPDDLAAGRITGSLLDAEHLAGRFLVEAIRRGLWQGDDYLPLRDVVERGIGDPSDAWHGTTHSPAFGAAICWLCRNPDRVPVPIEWSPTGRSDDDLVNGCPLLASIIEHEAATGHPGGGEPGLIRLPKLPQAILDLLEVADEPLTRSYIAGEKWSGNVQTEEQQRLANCVLNISTRPETISKAVQILLDREFAAEPFGRKRGSVITPVGHKHQVARQRSRR